MLITTCNLIYNNNEKKILEKFSDYLKGVNNDKKNDSIEIFEDNNNKNKKLFIINKKFIQNSLILKLFNSILDLVINRNILREYPSYFDVLIQFSNNYKEITLYYFKIDLISYFIDIINEKSKQINGKKQNIKSLVENFLNFISQLFFNLTKLNNNNNNNNDNNNDDDDGYEPRNKDMLTLETINHFISKNDQRSLLNSNLLFNFLNYNFKITTSFYSYISHIILTNANYFKSFSKDQDSNIKNGKINYYFNLFETHLIILKKKSKNKNILTRKDKKVIVILNNIITQQIKETQFLINQQNTFQSISVVDKGMYSTIEQVLNFLFKIIKIRKGVIPFLIENYERWLPVWLFVPRNEEIRKMVVNLFKAICDETIYKRTDKEEGRLIELFQGLIVTLISSDLSNYPKMKIILKKKSATGINSYNSFGPLSTTSRFPPFSSLTNESEVTCPFSELKRNLNPEITAELFDILSSLVKIDIINQLISDYFDDLIKLFQKINLQRIHKNDKIKLNFLKFWETIFLYQNSDKNKQILFNNPMFINNLIHFKFATNRSNKYNDQILNQLFKSYFNIIETIFIEKNELIVKFVIGKGTITRFLIHICLYNKKTHSTIINNYFNLFKYFKNAQSWKKLILNHLLKILQTRKRIINVDDNNDVISKKSRLNTNISKNSDTRLNNSSGYDGGNDQNNSSRSSSNSSSSNNNNNSSSSSNNEDKSEIVMLKLINLLILNENDIIYLNDSNKTEGIYKIIEFLISLDFGNELLKKDETCCFIILEIFNKFFTDKTLNSTTIKIKFSSALIKLADLFNKYKRPINESLIDLSFQFISKNYKYLTKIFLNKLITKMKTLVIKRMKKNKKKKNDDKDDFENFILDVNINKSFKNIENGEEMEKREENKKIGIKKVDGGEVKVDEKGLKEKKKGGKRKRGRERKKREKYNVFRHKFLLLQLLIYKIRSFQKIKQSYSPIISLLQICQQYNQFKFQEQLLSLLKEIILKPKIFHFLKDFKSYFTNLKDINLNENQIKLFKIFFSQLIHQITDKKPKKKSFILRSLDYFILILEFPFWNSQIPEHFISSIGNFIKHVKQLETINDDTKINELIDTINKKIN
ncbi:hypothetical protein M0813_15919 [Anaeramoeba flamelloides]|uniref:Uncharacterized protein n=1 Tax=Anaeramoeba flamelloides TaxID=1746091 RepID=A0ABQ8Z2Y2_9EUKA|nr:hypothetical protein M0813_15919 [Anaeramoeba flamelloides]